MVANNLAPFKTDTDSQYVRDVHFGIFGLQTPYFSFLGTPHSGPQKLWSPRKAIQLSGFTAWIDVTSCLKRKLPPIGCWGKLPF